MFINALLILRNVGQQKLHTKVDSKRLVAPSVKFKLVTFWFEFSALGNEPLS